MRSVMTLLSVSLVAVCLVAAGCGGSTPPAPPVADNHDHDAHDHGEHDHDEHGHDGHDHGAATTIDAAAAGLSADDLVSVDEPELPDNLNDAVKQLVELRDKIRDAFKADDADAAHNPLHEVGHLLGGIESLVADGDHDATHKKELDAAVEELFDSYTAVDETFHSDGGKEYNEVEAKIDAAIQTLQDHVGHGKE